MVHCIGNCTDCHRICLETANHSLAQGGKHAEVGHVRLLLECAQICQTSADFMARGPELRAHLRGLRGGVRALRGLLRGVRGRRSDGAARRDLPPVRAELPRDGRRRLTARAGGRVGLSHPPRPAGRPSPGRGLHRRSRKHPQAPDKLGLPGHHEAPRVDGLPAPPKRDAAARSRRTVRPPACAVASAFIAKSSRIGQSGRPSPEHVAAKCSSVRAVARSSAIFALSPATWPSATALTSALARPRSRHNARRSVICSTGKAEVARAPDEAQRVDVVPGVMAVTAFGARRLRDEAGRLVVTDHLGRDAGRPGRFAYVHHGSPSDGFGCAARFKRRPSPRA